MNTYLCMAFPYYTLRPLCGYFRMYAEFEAAQKLTNEFWEVEFDLSLKFTVSGLLIIWGFSSATGIIFIFNQKNMPEYFRLFDQSNVSDSVPDVF